MPRQTIPNLEFVESFVDALTVRPFFSDLRRMRLAPPTLRFSSQVDVEDVRPTATAA